MSDQDSAEQEIHHISPMALGVQAISRDQIIPALVKVQQELKAPHKNRTVKVKTQQGFYEFRYATLDAIIEHIRRPLTENGLWFTQTLQERGGSQPALVTTLYHVSGQSIQSVSPVLTPAGDSQAFGSGLSYLKRYQLTAILGIAADDDEDGNMADGNTVESSKDDRGGLEWVGPLPRTKLIEGARAVARDIANSSDVDELTGVMESGENKKVIEQLKQDAPRWWDHESDSEDGDNSGIKQRFMRKRQELLEAEEE